jgi:hypothetical protein
MRPINIGVGASLVLALAALGCAPPATPAPLLPPAQAPTETAAPTATATPEPSSTPTLTPTPVPNGPCDNPLVPLKVGNEWTYKVTTAEGESLFTVQAVERQDAANIVVLVDYTDQKNGITVHEPVICRDGAILDYPLFVMDMLFADLLNKPMNTYRDSGDYGPAYASFAENNWVLDWQAKYLLEEGARIDNPTGGEPLLVGQNSMINLSFQTDGTREPVTTPAGEFPDALKITQSYTLPSTYGNQGATLTLNTTQWYEPYVGLVKAQVDSASLSIFGPGIPVPLQSSLELVEFTPGE